MTFMLVPAKGDNILLLPDPKYMAMRHSMQLDIQCDEGNHHIKELYQC